MSTDTLIQTPVHSQYTGPLSSPCLICQAKNSTSCRNFSQMSLMLRLSSHNWARLADMSLSVTHQSLTSSVTGHTHDFNVSFLLSNATVCPQKGRGLWFSRLLWKKKSAIVAEIAASWNQLSAKRLSVCDGDGRWLRQQKLPEALLCSRWSRGLTIVYHVYLIGSCSLLLVSVPAVLYALLPNQWSHVGKFEEQCSFRCRCSFISLTYAYFAKLVILFIYMLQFSFYQMRFCLSSLLRW